MKLDCGYVLKNLDGSDAVDFDPKTKNPIPTTIGKILAGVLTVSDPKDTDGMRKARCYGLATQVYKEQEIEVDSEDVKLIKDLVGRYCPPMAVGQIYQILG